MKLSEYQKELDRLLSKYEKPYWEPLSQYARLVEEVGELGRILNHMYGDKVKKKSEEPDDLEGELADILYGLMCMANSHNISLEKAIEGALDKMESRDGERFAKKAT